MPRGEPPPFPASVRLGNATEQQRAAKTPQAALFCARRKARALCAPLHKPLNSPVFPLTFWLVYAGRVILVAVGKPQKERLVFHCDDCKKVHLATRMSSGEYESKTTSVRVDSAGDIPQRRCLICHVERAYAAFGDSSDPDARVWRDLVMHYRGKQAKESGLVYSEESLKKAVRSAFGDRD